MSTKKIDNTVRQSFFPQSRSIEIREVLPPHIKIFTEGEKTEPHYFGGFVNKIKAKFASCNIEVIPAGRNTLSLLKFAKKNSSMFDEVWLVFDKDDFPPDNFDNTIFALKDNSKWHMAWSNQCIEIWFLLHFNYRDTDMDRNQCMSDLNSLFQKYFGCNYTKNMPNLSDLLDGRTDVAIRNAKKLYKTKEGDMNISPHEMVPCTTVYELVEELQKYI